MFGQVASRYDLLNHLLSGNLDKSWRRRAVGRSEVSGRVVRVLDLCCGTGDLTLAMARHCGAGSHVVGVDFCEQMLVLGRAKAERDRGRAGRERTAEQRVSFTAGDALQLPFAHGLFDVVCVAFGIRNVEDPCAGLREMVRVTRPGGRVLVLEFAMPRRCLVRGLYRIYFRHLLPTLGRLVSQARVDAYRYLPASVEAFPARERFVGLMAGAGLVDLETEELSLGTVVLYSGRRLQGVGSTP